LFHLVISEVLVDAWYMPAGNKLMFVGLIFCRL